MTSTLAKRIETVTSVILSIAVLGAVAVRQWNAGALWRDECAAVQLARFSPVGIARDFTHEAFPPPFFFLIRLWTMLFGVSDASLRSYGFLVALGLIAALWLVFRLSKLGVPMISLGGIALSGSFLTWGTSIRGYGIGTAAVVTAFAGVTALLRKESRFAAIVAFGAAVLSVQLLLQNTIIILSIVGSAFVVCLILRDSNRALLMVGVALLAELSFAVYIPSYLKAREWSVVAESVVAKPTIVRQVGAFFGINSSLWPWIVSFCFAGLLGLALQKIYAYRHQKDALEFKLSLFGAVVCLTSIATLEIFLRTLNYVVQPWYLIAPFAVAVTGIDLIIATFCRSTIFRVIRVAGAVCLALILGWVNRSVLVLRQTNIDLIAKTLEQQADAGDLIVANPWQLGVPMQWYYHGNTTWITVPQIDDRRIHRYDLLKQKMESSHAIADVLQHTADTLRAGHKVWLVGGAMVSPAKRLGPLPPAPQSRFGWDNLAYLVTWSEQLGDVIRSDATGARRVPIDAGQRVNPLEDVPLIVVSGAQEPKSE